LNGQCESDVICDNYVGLQKNRSANDIIMTVVLCLDYYTPRQNLVNRLSGYKQAAAIDLASVE